MNDLQIYADVFRKLDEAFQNIPAQPSPAERRVKSMESVIKRFCETTMETGAYTGCPQSWWESFRELADCVDFDPESFNKQGYDRADV